MAIPDIMQTKYGRDRSLLCLVLLWLPASGRGCFAPGGEPVVTRLGPRNLKNVEQPLHVLFLSRKGGPVRGLLRHQRESACRGIRGATCAESNTAEAILNATRELLERIIAANDVHTGDVAAVIFTASPDLDAAYPAQAAREMGWTQVPMLCVQEMAVAGSLPRCIRVLILWNTDRPAERIRHVYLREARQLRPDWGL